MNCKNEILDLPALENSPKNYDLYNEGNNNQTTLGTPKFNNFEDKFPRKKQDFYAMENYRSETNPKETPQNNY